MCIWVGSLSCGCLVAWFCYQLMATPGNRAAAVSLPDPYVHLLWILGHCWLGGGLSPALCLAAALSQCWPGQNLALMWRGSTKHNIVHSVSVTELITEATLARDAPYLEVSYGMSVLRTRQNWPRHKGVACIWNSNERKRCFPCTLLLIIWLNLNGHDAHKASYGVYGGLGVSGYEYFPKCVDEYILVVRVYSMRSLHTKKTILN